MACHVRHNFIPIDQTNEKLFISCNILLDVTIQSHSTKQGCCIQKRTYSIVALINPIWHRYSVTHGTFFKVLIDYFVGRYNRRNLKALDKVTRCNTMMEKTLFWVPC